jgi:hypothetical protein
MANITNPLTGLPVRSLWDTVPSIVETHFTDAQQYAQSAFNIAQTLLASLQNIASKLQQIDTNVVIEGVDYSVDKFTGVRPTAPNLSVNMPSAPDKANFKDINLPTEPDLTGINFGSVGNIDPAVQYYSSTLLTAIKARLLIDVTTDLDRPDIEAAKWARATERDLLEHYDNMDRIRSYWAMGHLPLPDGALIAGLEAEEVRFGNRRQDRDREIMIAESDLAIKNMREATAQAIQIEHILSTFLNTVQDRIFQASKASAEMQIAVINAQIAQKRMMTDLYTAIVNARIAEARALVDIYTSEVQAFTASVHAESERLNAYINVFKSEVDAYVADSTVYKAVTSTEVAILDAQLKMAISRADLYLKNADIQIKEYEWLNGIKVEAIKAEGSIAAQLVAGALSGIHAAADIGAHVTGSDSYDESAVEIEQMREEFQTSQSSG